LSLQQLLSQFPEAGHYFLDDGVQLVH
jgi:hypothetical protein